MLLPVIDTSTYEVQYIISQNPLQSIVYKVSQYLKGVFFDSDKLYKNAIDPKTNKKTYEEVECSTLELNDSLPGLYETFVDAKCMIRVTIQSIEAFTINSGKIMFNSGIGKSFIDSDCFYRQI